MMTNIATKTDLRNWVDSALGADGTEEMVEAVTDYLQSADHPPYGTDWTDYLTSLDVWHIVTGLHL